MTATSSPDDAGLRELAGGGSAVGPTTPVWSSDELSRVYGALETEGLRRRVVEVKYERAVTSQSLYDTHGGVPRGAGPPSGVGVTEALEGRGPAVAEGLLNASRTFGTGPGTEKSCTLVHLVPRTRGDGSCSRSDDPAGAASGRVPGTTAGTYSTRALSTRRSHLARSGAGGTGAPLQGHRSESSSPPDPPREARPHAPSGGRSPGSGTTDSDEGAVKAPEVARRFDNYTDTSWTPGVLHVPSGSSPESGGAPLVEGAGEEGEPHVPQLTLAETRPVKAKGLLRAVKYPRDSGYEVDSSRTRSAPGACDKGGGGRLCRGSDDQLSDGRAK